ncbi:MAG: hypothetical protein C4K58_04570 [Flavobacteriaceae bacterium]|nr:MAG: hypothetical protein C4K58_04570 [Flavobacteriaceae bacterium]
MALLSKIREKTWLLVASIVVASLAFLIGDPSQIKSWFAPDPNVVGEINGEEISAVQLDQQAASIAAYSGVDPSIAQSQAWDQLVGKKLLTQRAEKNFSGYSDEMFWQAVAYHKAFQGNPEVTDENGMPNPQKAKNFVSKIINDADKGTDPNAVKLLEAWKGIEKEIKESLVINDYFGMVAQGILITQSEADYVKKAMGTTNEIQYIKIPYSSLQKLFPSVKVSDQEIDEFIKKRPKTYKKGARGNVNYVVFDASPSPLDIAKAKSELTKFLSPSKEINPVTKLEETLEPFSATQDFASYVNAYSDVPYDGNPTPIANFPKNVQAFLNASSKGATSGIIEDEDRFSLVKIIEKSEAGVVAASLVKKKVASEQTQNQALKSANEFMAASQGISANDFINNAKKKGYRFYSEKEIEKKSAALPGVIKTRTELVNWIFDPKTEKDQMSLISSSDSQEYIIARMGEKSEAGFPSVESVKAEVTPLILNKKLAQSFGEKYNGKTLEEISAQTKIPAKTTQISPSAPLIETAQENILSGVLVSLKDGKTSTAIQGQSALYVLKSVGKNTDKIATLDTKQIQEQLSQRVRQNIVGDLVESLKNEAKIEDLRN